MLSFGRAKEACDILAAVVDASSKASAKEVDARILVQGIEAALRAADFEKAEAWEQRLAAAAPADALTPRYYRARRMLDQFPTLSLAERAETERLVADVQKLRPSWGEAVALTARLAELQNNSAQAIDQYQQAIALGSRSPAIVERLVALLYQTGRYAEADEYFARLSEKAQSTPAMESLAIANALQQNRLAPAIELAKKAAESHPDDPLRQMWYANLLAHRALEQKEAPVEAEAAFRETLQRFPKDVRVWNALFNVLFRAGEIDEAKKLLADFSAELGENSWDLHVVSAQAYQQLGESAQAVREAEAASRLKPDDVATRLLLGKLLMSVDVARATAEFDRLLNDKSKEGDVEALRHWALLVAASGTEEQQQLALKRLEDAEGDHGAQEDAVNSRLRAALMIQQGRNREERTQSVSAARKVVEQRVIESGAIVDDVDRILLAKLYEKEAWLRNDLALLQAAREQLQHLAGRADAPIAYISGYADFLIRQLTRTIEPEDKAFATAWKNTREILVSDAQGRVLELDNEVRERGAAIDCFKLLSCRARLLFALGKTEEARAAVAAFAESQLSKLESEAGPARAQLSVAQLFATIDAHVEAEHWYRRVMEIAPEAYELLVRELAAQGRTDEAIRACLAVTATNERDAARAATLLAQLMSGAPTGVADSEGAEALIAKALDEHGDNVELLMSMAVLNVTRNNNDEAIRYFRRVVELAPSNALALNNLATLLAEQPAAQREALELINRAIEASGRQPELLDTLGTIQLRAGQTADAIMTLEESVAGGGGDPRYHFHLAAAYRKAGNQQEARKALARAHQLGLAKAILTAGDQALLQELEREFGPLDSSAPVDSQSTMPKIDVSQRRSLSLAMAAA
jgi:pentatricopeptide repeat protein